MLTKVFLALSLAASSLASAGHNHHHHHARTAAHSSPALMPRGMDCSRHNPKLRTTHCNYMKSIGICEVGVNAVSSAGGNKVWLGKDGPNTFTFTSRGAHSILVFWVQNPGDYQASFVNARQAAITVTVRRNANVTISVANGVSGAFSHIRPGHTKLTSYGQISNTWGEYTTGEWATVDVSREVDMNGRHLSMKTHNGCVSNMDTCVFVCKSGTSCISDYQLNNCNPSTNKGAALGLSYGQPSGGCQGWSNGGHIRAVLG